jgi:hypothetical protein
MTTDEKKYSVFVDGSEVNSFYMEKSEAKMLAKEYKEDGYELVEVVDMSEYMK